MGNDQNHGWLLTGVSILAITMGVSLLNQTLALWIGSGLSGLLLVFPILAVAQVNRLTRQQHYRRARQLSSVLCWLQPTGGWGDRQILLLAMEKAQGGNIPAATTLLRRYQQTCRRPVHEALALIYWIQADWQGCLYWMKQEIPQNVLLAEPELFVYYLLALGETGDLNGLLRAMAMAEISLEKNGDRRLLNVLRLFVLAFCGQVATVRQLFHIVLGEYPKTVQKFWLLTALMFAGKQKVAREQLLTLRLQGDLILSNAIDWRLCHPLIAPTEVLEKRSWKILARIKSNITRDVNRDQFFKNRQSKPYITISLIGINLIFYFIEIAAGGGENLRTIYQLGALVPKEVIGGDWWRMITSNFLHYGWWHLLTNMIGLYFIGRFLESALSRIQYLLIYFISGIGSMFLFSLCTVLIGDSRQILVGASAAIMGLIGAMLSLFWRDWWRHRSRYSLQRLQILLLIIFLQFGIDFIFPNISFLSHIGGLIIGFLIANLFVSSKYTNY